MFTEGYMRKLRAVGIRHGAFSIAEKKCPRVNPAVNL